MDWWKTLKFQGDTWVFGTGATDSPGDNTYLREVFKKLRRENLRPKNATGGGGGGQRCQKDTTVPTKSDFISNYIGPF